MQRTGAPVEIGAASREFFPASSLLTEAIVRRAGALAALGAATVLVSLLVLFPEVEQLKHGVLAAYAIVLLGCGAVLFSPAYRAVAELARRAAEATGEILGAPWRAATEPWSETAAAVRATGALVALTAASALVPLLMPVPAAVASKNIDGVLALYVGFLLGCAAVLLSPAHRAARNIFNAMGTGRVLRWAGFACICAVFCTICAVGSVRADNAAATTVAWSPERFGGLVLFLLFLAGVWTVTLSTVTTGWAPPTLPVQLLLPLPPPPPVQDERGGGAVNCTAPAGDCDGVASHKV